MTLRDACGVERSLPVRMPVDAAHQVVTDRNDYEERLVDPEATRPADAELSAFDEYVLVVEGGHAVGADPVIAPFCKELSEVGLDLLSCPGRGRHRSP